MNVCNLMPSTPLLAWLITAEAEGTPYQEPRDDLRKSDDRSADDSKINPMSDTHSMLNGDVNFSIYPITRSYRESGRKQPRYLLVPPCFGMMFGLRFPDSDWLSCATSNHYLVLDHTEH
ncbi:MAG: hypothetical protein AAGB04_26670 [Pseudomonadota bacterium]